MADAQPGEDLILQQITITQMLTPAGDEELHVAMPAGSLMTALGMLELGKAYILGQAAGTED